MTTGTEVVPGTGTDLVPADVDARAAEVERQVEQARAQAEAMQVRTPEEVELASALLREIQRRRKAAEAERKELTGPLDEAKRRIMQKFKDAMAPFDPVDKIIREKVEVYEDEQARIRREEEERLERERQERERKAREAREKQEAEERAKREQAERETREAEELAKAAKDAEEREAAEKLAEEARVAAQEAATAESAIASLPEVELPKAVVEAAPKPQGISRRMVWRHTVTDPAAVPREYCEVSDKSIRQAVRDGVREIPGVKIEQVPEMAVRG